MATPYTTPPGAAMDRRNDEVAALLQEYADLLAITGGDAFKVAGVREGGPVDRRVPPGHRRARRRRAARDPERRRVDRRRRSRSTCAPGGIHALEELRAKVPAGVRELTAIPTLGPEEGDGAVQRARRRLGRRRWSGRSARAGCTACAGSGRRPRRTCCTASSCCTRPAAGCTSTWPSASPSRSWPRCPPCPAATGARTPGRCAGCGRRSATWTCSPPPTTRPH